MKPRSLISVADLTPGELRGLLALASRVKSEPERYRSRLSGKSLGLIFEKSSTRTRVSFEVGMFQLGGQGLFLSNRDLQLGRGETISDTALVLSRYVDGIMARTFAHQTVVDLAKYGTIPVINGLTDDLHPCQALADFFTLKEVFGDLMGRKLAYVGDGNNVVHSLMITAPMLGMDIAVATPEGYEPNPAYVEKARSSAVEAGTKIELMNEHTISRCPTKNCRWRSSNASRLRKSCVLWQYIYPKLMKWNVNCYLKNSMIRLAKHLPLWESI